MIKGIHTALVTPFDMDQRLDENALKRSVRHQIKAGAAGLCPLGGTGEPLSQSLDEHRRVIDLVMAEAGGHVPVTVGCLMANQSDVVAAARHAEAAGADHIMVVPPYFYGARLFDIRQHMETIATACSLPIILFHTPGRSGIRLSADEVLEILQGLSVIHGIKDASGDVILAGQIIREAPDGFSFLQGLDELLLPTLALGAAGGIVSLAELLPRTLAALYHHVCAGEWEEARQLQLAILPVCKWIYSEPNPGPLKYALKLAGRPAGPCRNPIYGPREATRAALDQLVPPLLERET